MLYVEGGTDVDMLRALAERLGHRAARLWDERINSFYVQNNYPKQDMDAELERVEGGFGITPKQHFDGLRNLLPSLKGLAILDNDGRNRQDITGPLSITYWKRYEAENYFITPDVLREYARADYQDMDLFRGFTAEIDEVLDTLVLEQVFEGTQADFETWKQSPTQVSRLLWEAKTERRKLSTLAEEFFRRLALRLGGQMLLKKGELHRLVPLVHPQSIAPEVSEKLDRLADLFEHAIPEDAAAIAATASTEHTK